VFGIRQAFMQKRAGSGLLRQRQIRTTKKAAREGRRNSSVSLKFSR
jgi:hypothetical protein